MGTLVHPCRVQTIRIAWSKVMDMLGKVVQELDYNFSLKLDVGGTNG